MNTKGILFAAAFAVLFNISGCNRQCDCEDPDQLTPEQQKKREEFFDMSDPVDFNKDKGIPLTPTPEKKSNK